MADTTIVSLGTGGKLALSPGGEITEPALGDGTAKAGNLVGVLSATGKVVMTDLGGGATKDVFVGILDKRYDIAVDTAITDGASCNIIVPTSGKKYAIRITDPGGALPIGWPFTWSATAGELVKTTNLATTLERNVCYLARAAANGDTVAIVRWA